MIDLIEQHRNQLMDLCLRHGVQSLELFGSAADGRWDSERSDLDFLVQFSACEPRLHYEHYFGLLESLQELFARPIDLVEVDAMRNPYFIRSVQPSRRLLYAA